MPVARQFGDLVRLLQDAASVGHDTFADRCNVHKSSGALDQSHAELLFKLANWLLRVGWVM